MVDGIEKFGDHFKEQNDCYVLIGGAACDLWLTDAGLPYRATRDLDLVLVLKALEPEFFKTFWEFIKAAGYTSLIENQDTPKFYRFEGPSSSDYPYMIELLTHNVLDLPSDTHLTPVPSPEDLSSLSAILMNDEYYQFVVKSKAVMADISLATPSCLIPLKIRAYLDLSQRREAGDMNVKGDDIKKHRNDVFRLSLTFAPENRFDLPDLLKTDMRKFLEEWHPSAVDWPAIQAAVGRHLIPNPAATISLIEQVYQLSD